MTDYRKYINALRKCAKEHENDITSIGHIIVADLCRDTANLLEELEQDPNTGHWIEEFNDSEGEVRFICSSCGKYQLFGTDFCYHCGAKMAESEG